MQSNLCGQLAILEFCKSKMRGSRPIKNFVYASSSSVYGSNKQIPFSINDNTDQPVSFYGATKKAGAMKGGMAILRPLLIETGAPQLGKMVIGTVKGDIHDIGKNLVSMMMEGAGFDVVDFL